MLEVDDSKTTATIEHHEKSAAPAGLEKRWDCGEAGEYYLLSLVDGGLDASECAAFALQRNLGPEQLRRNAERKFDRPNLVVVVDGPHSQPG